MIPESGHSGHPAYIRTLQTNCLIFDTPYLYYVQVRTSYYKRTMWYIGFEQKRDSCFYRQIVDTDRFVLSDYIFFVELCVSSILYLGVRAHGSHLHLLEQRSVSVSCTKIPLDKYWSIRRTNRTSRLFPSNEFVRFWILRLHSHIPFVLRLLHPFRDRRRKSLTTSLHFNPIGQSYR